MEYDLSLSFLVGGMNQCRFFYNALFIVDSILLI